MPIATANGNTMARAMNWLTGQPAYIVLLVLVLAANGYIVHWAMTQGWPSAVKEIQRGYDLINERHRAERQEWRADVQEERAETRQVLDKLGTALDRLLNEQVEINRRLLEKK